MFSDVVGQLLNPQLLVHPRELEPQSRHKLHAGEAHHVYAKERRRIAHARHFVHRPSSGSEVPGLDIDVPYDAILLPDRLKRLQHLENGLSNWHEAGNRTLVVLSADVVSQCVSHVASAHLNERDEVSALHDEGDGGGEVSDQKNKLYADIQAVSLTHRFTDWINTWMLGPNGLLAVIPIGSVCSCYDFFRALHIGVVGTVSRGRFSGHLNHQLANEIHQQISYNLR